MCLARLRRLMDLRTRYTHAFSALASGRSASWAKLVIDFLSRNRTKQYNYIIIN